MIPELSVSLKIAQNTLGILSQVISSRGATIEVLFENDERKLGWGNEN